MARPKKQGLQYFPLDVDIFDDEKIQQLNDNFGFLGEIIYIRLLTMIYQNGYYVERTVPLVARHLMRTKGPDDEFKSNEFEAVILYLGEIGLLNKEMMFNGVLTSKAIQIQFILSTRRRRDIDIDEYWLLDKKTMMKLNIKNISKCDANDDTNEVIDDNTQDNVNNNCDFKGSDIVNVDNNYIKESKVKERDKKIKDKGTFQVPFPNFFTSVLIKNKYIESDSLEITKYNKLFEELIGFYNYDDCLSVMDYLMKYSKRTEVTIENKYSFLKESFINNLEMLEKRNNKNDKIEDLIKQALL